MADSGKDLPTPLMSTASAQPRKRATWGEQEVGLSWYSLRHRSNATNSLEQSCLIFWITGLSKQIEQLDTMWDTMWFENEGVRVLQ